MKRLQKKLMFSALIIGCCLLSGCATVDMDYTFHEDGTISFTETAEAKADVAKDAINEQKEASRKSKAKIKETSNGFIATKNFKDATDLVNNGGDAWNPNEEHNGVRLKKGFLYDYYSLDLYFKGQKVDLPKSNYKANVPAYNGKGNAVKYWDRRRKAEQEAEEMNRLHDEAVQSGKNAFKLDFTINLPEAADSSNADNIKNNGKTLVWDLKPAAMDNKNITARAIFRIYHKQTVAILEGVGLIVTVAGVVLLVLGFKKTDMISRKKYISGAVILLVIVGSVGGYAAYTIKYPPAFSVKDRIIAKDAKDSDGKPLANTWAKKKDVSENSVSEAQAYFRDNNVPYSVLAVSKSDYRGYLVLAERGDERVIFVYDKTDDRFAWAAYKDEIVNFKNRYRKTSTGQKDYNPLIFLLDMPNDDKNGVDSKLGLWKGIHHHIPIYALFTVNQNGEVVPGMIHSGPGQRPSHYHSPLNDKKTVNMVNLLLTHMDSLKADIQVRGVELPKE